MYTSQSPLYIIHTPVYTVIYFPLFYNIHIMYTVVYGVNISTRISTTSITPTPSSSFKNSMILIRSLLSAQREKRRRSYHNDSEHPKHGKQQLCGRLLPLSPGQVRLYLKGFFHFRLQKASEAASTCAQRALQNTGKSRVTPESAAFSKPDVCKSLRRPRLHLVQRDLHFLVNL